ncbi:MAG: HEAT repeat domain-containing protein, partial [Planctomycetota bacterium]|nr:HEAT repeat domain-containing protein [Planctomycetota bacterium]
APAGLEAVRWGLGHPSPVVKRVCLEILDTHPDAETVPLIVGLLDDPVPRVRWHAVHALSCEGCKAGVGVLTPEVEARVRALAESDPNARVRDQARLLVA